jgi:hypothetical protein
MKVVLDVPCRLDHTIIGHDKPCSKLLPFSNGNVFKSKPFENPLNLIKGNSCVFGETLELAS